MSYRGRSCGLVCACFAACPRTANKLAVQHLFACGRWVLCSTAAVSGKQRIKRLALCEHQARVRVLPQAAARLCAKGEVRAQEHAGDCSSAAGSAQGARTGSPGSSQPSRGIQGKQVAAQQRASSLNLSRVTCSGVMRVQLRFPSTTLQWARHRIYMT